MWSMVSFEMYEMIWNRDWISGVVWRCCTAKTVKWTNRRWPCLPFALHSDRPVYSNCLTRRPCLKVNIDLISHSSPWIKGQFSFWLSNIQSNLIWSHSTGIHFDMWLLICVWFECIIKAIENRRQNTNVTRVDQVKRIEWGPKKSIVAKSICYKFIIFKNRKICVSMTPRL